MFGEEDLLLIFSHLCFVQALTAWSPSCLHEPAAVFVLITSTSGIFTYLFATVCFPKKKGRPFCLCSLSYPSTVRAIHHTLQPLKHYLQIKGMRTNERAPLDTEVFPAKTIDHAGEEDSLSFLEWNTRFFFTSLCQDRLDCK